MLFTVQCSFHIDYKIIMSLQVGWKEFKLKTSNLHKFKNKQCITVCSVFVSINIRHYVRQISICFTNLQTKFLNLTNNKPDNHHLLTNDINQRQPTISFPIHNKLHQHTLHSRCDAMCRGHDMLPRNQRRPTILSVASGL